jgi:hypothetical protein
LQKTAACLLPSFHFFWANRQQSAHAQAGAVAKSPAKWFSCATSNNLVASGQGLDVTTGYKKLEKKMKKFALAAALTLAATTAFAGGMEVPVMEEAPIVAEVTNAGSSNGGLVIPLLLLLLLAAAASNSNGG